MSGKEIPPGAIEAGQPLVGTDSPDEKSVQAARRFFLAFYGGLHAIRHQPQESIPWREAFHELASAAETIVRAEGELELRIVRQFILVNRIKLKSEVHNYGAFGHVLRTLQRAGVGVLRAEGLAVSRTWHSLLFKIIAFAGKEPGPDRLSELQEELTARDLEIFSVGPTLEGESDSSTEMERKQAARSTYEKSVEVSKELFEGARMGRSTNVKQIKHAVQGIVDQVLHNEASLGGLSMLNDYDDYAFTHSVNVCIFCVAIGRRLGLSKGQLYDLGLAALVHDLGMSRIPVEILTKGSRLSQEEEIRMQAHTWLGALSIFGLRDYGGIPYQSMIVAYEHHMKIDLSGYPAVVRPRKLSVFSKIIAVAAAFDAATNTRSYSATRPPDEVLRMLWEEKHLGFDPVVVKALINLLGIYPVGTCVILDTFELGLVHEANSDLNFIHRPIVRILSSPDGSWLYSPLFCDLSESGQDRTFLRSIIKVTDPARYGLKVSDYYG